MPTLHYGPGLRTFEIAPEDVAGVLESIGEKSHGGPSWYSFTDAAGKAWSVLISPGIPIFIDAVPEV